MISLYDGKYHIEDDTTCYKLTRKTVSKKDPEKVSYSFVGYFSNIQEALKRIYDDEVKKSVNENDYQYERKTPSFSYGDISDKSQYLEV